MYLNDGFESGSGDDIPQNRLEYGEGQFIVNGVDFTEEWLMLQDLMQAKFHRGIKPEGLILSADEQDEWKLADEGPAPRWDTETVGSTAPSLTMQTREEILRQALESQMVDIMETAGYYGDEALSVAETEEEVLIEAVIKSVDDEEALRMDLEGCLRYFFRENSLLYDFLVEILQIDLDPVIARLADRLSVLTGNPEQLRKQLKLAYQELKAQNRIIEEKLSDEPGVKTEERGDVTSKVAFEAESFTGKIVNELAGIS